MTIKYIPSQGLGAGGNQMYLCVASMYAQVRWKKMQLLDFRESNTQVSEVHRICQSSQMHTFAVKSIFNKDHPPRWAFRRRAL